MALATANVEVRRVGSKWTKPNMRFSIAVTTRIPGSSFTSDVTLEQFEPGDVLGTISAIGAIAHWHAEIAAGLADESAKHAFHIERGESGRFLWCDGCKFINAYNAA